MAKDGAGLRETSFSGYPLYVLWLLFLVGLLNYIDRSILSILQVPIKAELKLSDTQMGMLSGLAFALFYTAMAIPIARLADRTNRKRLLTLAVSAWSLMTALCGFAGSFAALFLCRMGVAIGEAGSAPMTHALISDYFPRERRAFAISLWGLSLPIGAMLGVLSGGMLNEFFGWRTAFVVVGCSGLIVIPLLLFTLREPVRGVLDRHSRDFPVAAPPPLRVAAGLLWNLKSFRYLVLAAALHQYATASIHAWDAHFFHRVHEMPLRNVALTLGLLGGAGGLCGMFLGGWLSDRFGKADARAYAVIPAIASLLFTPVGLFQYLVPDVRLSIAAVFLTGLLGAVFMGPLMGTAQSLVAPNIRAFTSATLVLFVNITGACLGPVLTGVLSDAFSSYRGLGSDGLRYAMALSCVIPIGAAYFYVHCSRYLRADLKLQEPQEALRRH